MKLSQLGSNMVEIETPTNIKILFSYETPVAYIENGKGYKTKTFHSRTTSKHINKFFDGLNSGGFIIEKPEYVDNSFVE